MTDINNLFRAIAYLDMDFLFTLALEDTEGVIRKISIRQLGRKRIDRLHSHIAGMDQKKLRENKSFLLCIMGMCAYELTPKSWKSGPRSNNAQDAEVASSPGNTNQQPEQWVGKEETPSQEKTLLTQSLSTSRLPSEPQGESEQDQLLQQPKEKRGPKKNKPSGVDHSEARRQIIEHLNKLTGKEFDPDSKASRQAVDKMLDAGKPIDQFIKIIDNKTPRWIDNPEMNDSLCPQTLFRDIHWEKYLNYNVTTPKGPGNPPPTTGKKSKYGDSFYL